MRLNQYQEAARNTAVYPTDMGLIYTTLGLVGESGEVAEKVKKMIRDGKTLKECRADLVKELGDVLWYAANVAHELNITLEEVASRNIEKLHSRQSRDKLHGDGDDR
jgi:NTP pyrophosphatase (non-canonical NTP hydrolase)